MTTPTPSPASARAMREALEECAETFARYAITHAEKRTPEGDTKSETNRRLAHMCIAVLAAPPSPEQAGSASVLREFRRLLQALDDGGEEIARDAEHVTYRYTLAASDIIDDVWENARSTIDEAAAPEQAGEFARGVEAAAKYIEQNDLGVTHGQLTVRGRDHAAAIRALAREPETQTSAAREGGDVSGCSEKEPWNCEHIVKWRWETFGNEELAWFDENLPRKTYADALGKKLGAQVRAEMKRRGLKFACGE